MVNQIVRCHLTIVSKLILGTIGSFSPSLAIKHITESNMCHVIFCLLLAPKPFAIYFCKTESQKNA